MAVEFGGKDLALTAAGDVHRAAVVDGVRGAVSEERVGGANAKQVEAESE
jgi:hypothetical protein